MMPLQFITIRFQTQSVRPKFYDGFLVLVRDLLFFAVLYIIPNSWYSEIFLLNPRIVVATLFGFVDLSNRTTCI